MDEVLDDVDAVEHVPHRRRIRGVRRGGADIGSFLCVTASRHGEDVGAIGERPDERSSDETGRSENGRPHRACSSSRLKPREREGGWTAALSGVRFMTCPARRSA